MNQEVTITLTLPLLEAKAVLDLLALEGIPSESNFKVPTSPKVSSQVQRVERAVKTVTEALRDSSPPVVNATATVKGSKPKPKMPSFGRSQSQIDSYESSEASRIDMADEETKFKLQQAGERAVRKAEKDVIADAKKQEKQHAEDEVAAIKAADLSAITPTHKVVKPWDTIKTL